MTRDLKNVTVTRTLQMRMGQQLYRNVCKSKSENTQHEMMKIYTQVFIQTLKIHIVYTVTALMC